LESGLTLSKLSYNFLGRRQNPFNAPPYQDYVTFNEKGSSGTEQAYVSWKFRPTENISLVNGVHTMRFDLTGEISVEPRSSIRWQLNPQQSIHAGYGLHSRMESLEYYFGKFVQSDGTVISYNEDLKFTKAHHVVIGYNQALSSLVNLRAEVYYQSLFHVPISADPVQGRAFSALNLTSGYTQIDLVNEGTGKNYGVEVTLERKFEKNFYYLTNVSLYESTYTGSDEVERNTRFNGNFSFNLLGGKEFLVRGSKNNIIGINSKVSWAGNKRYVPVDLKASEQEGREIRNPDLAFANRYPDHLRADLQIVYRRNTKRFTSEWRLDIQNITNRRNVMGDYYDGRSHIFEKGLGLIPVLSYRIEF
jgi:hypothetical protein